MEELKYKAYFYRIKYGTGKCNSCSKKGNKNLLNNIPWNKGRHISGMSGHKQSEHQKSVTRKRNLKDNPSKKAEVKEKMRLVKLGKTGTLANNWQGGKTQGQKKRQLQECKDWRMSVFKRDNFTCVVCNVVGGKLNAHHIKEWAKFPELRLDVNNGVTMCEECHKLYHKEARNKLLAVIGG